VGGFTAASGSTVYDGGAWPDEYRSIHFVCECTINLVHQDRLIPDGVTFRGSKVRAEEFVAGTDSGSARSTRRSRRRLALHRRLLQPGRRAQRHARPKHGPFNAAVRPDRDHEHGRIWRLQYKELRRWPTRTSPRSRASSKAFEHPNRWARLTAQRLLVEQGAGAEELAALLKSTSKPEAKVSLSGPCSSWVRSRRPSSWRR